tara:strand:- start:3 stop:182 length:180 start_codon:yes stop_codon:yes gene_type:complete
MGCFVSKNIKKEDDINKILSELHNEITRLKRISDKIAFDNALLKDKIYLLELQHIRVYS